MPPAATRSSAPGSDRGNEVLAHVAARLDLPFAANVTEVRGDEVTRQRWGGTLLEEARVHSERKLFTAAPFAFEAGDSLLQAEVETLRPDVGDAVQVVERVVPDTGGKVSLADAKVVVSGGRGVGSAEGFAILEELAGAARRRGRLFARRHERRLAAAHRPGRADRARRCRRTSTSPAGSAARRSTSPAARARRSCSRSTTIPEATIFTHADYAVIGDLHEIVPAISAELRKAREA